MPNPVRLGLLPRFAATSLASESKLSGLNDEGIIYLLKRELPTEFTPLPLELAYTKTSNGLGVLESLFVNHSSPTPRAILQAFQHRYIITNYRPQINKSDLLLHPILAMMENPIQDYNRKAEDYFPHFFAVIDMPDKARAAKLLRSAFYETLDHNLVERFINEVLPKR